MAIAALEELVPLDAADEAALDLPWPRPALQVVGPLPASRPGCHGEEPGITRGVTQRRHRRRALRARRRTVGVAVVLVVLGALLALPLHGLAGRADAVSAQVGGAAGTLYVVQPGDTVGSIAARFSTGGNPRLLAAALERELHSASVVPGEHVVIPFA